MSGKPPTAEQVNALIPKTHEDIANKILSLFPEARYNQEGNYLVRSIAKADGVKTEQWRVLLNQRSSGTTNNILQR